MSKQSTTIGPVLEFALSQTWAMEPGFHRRMMQVLARHEAGIKLDDEAVAAATGKAMPERAAELRIDGRTAVVPIHGVIAHRAGAVGRVSSRVGTSVEHIRADLETALADDDVDSIVLDVDSPGGSVAGIEELAAEIRAARDQKPIIAHTDGMMASAAYWLASQASRVSSTRSAAVGSIGVIASFYDTHRADQNAGFDPVVIKSTAAKGGVQGNGTLSDADRADVQREVDQYHALFVEAVAAGRRIDLEVAGQLADGRVYIGSDAKERGYVDAIETLATTIKHARKLAKAMPERAKAQTTDPVGSTSPSDGAVDSPVEKATRNETMSSTNTGSPAPSNAGQEDAIRKQAIEAERARCSAIRRAAIPEQDKLVAELIDGGADASEAIARLAEDMKVRLLAIKQASGEKKGDEPLAAGNSSNPVGNADKVVAAVEADGESAWRKEFDASAELQAEFQGDFSLFTGWKRNQAALKTRRPA